MGGLAAAVLLIGADPEAADPEAADPEAATPEAENPGPAAPAAGSLSYLDGPPPGHTGGFGEPSCHTCHFDAPLNAPDGEVALLGVPESYHPDSTYALTLRIEHPDLERGGFQISARHAEGEAAGEQAGAWSSPGGRIHLTKGENAIVYLHHSEAGTRPDSGRAVMAWTFRWRAPAPGSGPVIFHAAANAADGDASELGDHVYLAEARSAPPMSRP